MNALLIFILFIGFLNPQYDEYILCHHEFADVYHTKPLMV